MLQKSTPLHTSVQCSNSFSETITPILFHPRNMFDNVLKLNEKTPDKIINHQSEEYNSYENLLPNRYGVSHLLLWLGSTPHTFNWSTSHPASINFQVPLTLGEVLGLDGVR